MPLLPQELRSFQVSGDLLMMFYDLFFPLFYLLPIFVLQEFSLLQLDDVADQRVNIIGFSVFNKTHPFYQDFVISLNRSWQENCDHAPFAGTPVSPHDLTYAHIQIPKSNVTDLKPFTCQHNANQIILTKTAYCVSSHCVFWLHLIEHKTHHCCSITLQTT